MGTFAILPLQYVSYETRWDHASKGESIEIVTYQLYELVIVRTCQY